MESSNIKKDIFFHYVNNRSNDDLFVIAFGHEKCSVSKEPVGPMKKNHYFLHYILDGKGTYILNNKTYELGKNEAFVCYPNLEFYYKQDETTPWEYIWIEFSGLKAKEYLAKSLFSVENPTNLCHDPNILNSLLELLECPENEVSLELNSLSHLYKLFAQLINERNPKMAFDSSKRDFHIQLAIKYIENNYSNSDLSLIEISKNLHINSSYLSRIFKKITGVTLSKFIIDFRIQKAGELLEKKEYQIKDIAYMVGYSDPHFFSNEFKKHRGISPKKFEMEGSYIKENEGENNV